METLTTDRLIIRPFTIDDLDTAHQMLDQDIQWAGPSFSREQRRHSLQFYINLAEWPDTGRLYGYRAICLKETKQLIGLCGFLPGLMPPQLKALFWPALFGPAADPAEMAYATSELELGYALSSQYRRQGYATEAVSALIAHAFAELKVRRLFAGTNRRNTGSIALMRRVGMRIVDNPQQPERDWPDGPGVMGVIENHL
jgi:RimJ/RimL family protein N-acetyltransferase